MKIKSPKYKNFSDNLKMVDKGTLKNEGKSKESKAKREKISKEKIISAFLTVSFKKSSSGTALSDIADELGIKKASLYNHYENRDAIVSDVLSFCDETLSNLQLVPSDFESKSISDFAICLFKLLDLEQNLKIVSLIESEKFFNSEAFNISEKFKIRLIKFVKNTKILSEEVSSHVEFFVSGILSLMNEFISAKKMMNRNGEEIEFSEEKIRMLLSVKIL